MKKSLVLSPDVEKRLRALSEAERVGTVLALLELRRASGNPRVHSGLGIGKLQTNIFECRAGLTNRFGFQGTGDTLVVIFLGNHDDLRRWLRGR